MSRLKKIRVQKRIRTVQKAFQEHFIFDEKPIFADCRQKDSSELKVVKASIANIKKKCIEAAPEVPVLCHEMRFEILPDLRKVQRQRSSGQFTSKKKFKSQMRSRITPALLSKVFNVLIQYLSESGEILEMRDRLLIDVEWLCRHIVAPIISSEAFPISLSSKKDGIVHIDQIEEVLESFSEAYGTPTVKPKSAVKILKFLGLCIALKSMPGFYQFPSKVQLIMPLEAWQKEQRMQVYAGWHICCESDLDIINPSAFTALQSVIAQMRGLHATTWKAGIQISKEEDELLQSGVEVLVSLKDETRMVQGIDIIARGPKNSERNCRMFLSEIYHVAMKMIDQKSPGTSVVKRYLSRKQISNHIARPMSYTEDQITAAKKGNGVVSVSSACASVTETIVDLLAVQDDHIILLSQQTRQLVCGLLDKVLPDNDWRMVGLLLGIPSDRLESFEMSAPGSGITSSGSTEKMLNFYSQSMHATTGKLLEVLSTVDRADVIDVLNKDKDSQFTIRNYLGTERIAEAAALTLSDGDSDHTQQSSESDDDGSELDSD